MKGLKGFRSVLRVVGVLEVTILNGFRRSQGVLKGFKWFYNGVRGVIWVLYGYFNHIYMYNPYKPL